MSRDPIIERIFTTADDAMQGLWGFHNYVNAAVETNRPDQKRLKQQLPDGGFKLTHEWTRLYSKSKMVDEITDAFEFVHCRQSIVSLVAISEAFMYRFIQRLDSLGKVIDSTRSYKGRLELMFKTVEHTTSGSQTMLNRLPTTCGDVDNARRLRNCCAHNNGKYDEQYGNDAINNGWVDIRMQDEYHQEYKNRGSSPIFLINTHFENFCRSHIEFLHILHNTIQAKWFGVSQGYTYADEGKEIEWHRIISGSKVAGM